MRLIVHRLAAGHDRRQGNTSPALVAAVLLLAAAGGLIGYLVPFGTTDSDRSAVPTAHSAPPEVATSPRVTETTRLASLHRFPLTDADMAETAEAPSLAIDENGRVYLAFASQIGDAECALWLTDSRDGGATLSEPRTVVTSGIHTTVSESQGRRVERRTRMMPHIAAARDRLFLSWVSAGELREDVIMQFAESSDAGATFSEAIDVHRDRNARPTFTGMGVGTDGTVICSWLDNRNGTQQPFAAVRRASESEFSPEQMVYAGADGEGICPCCPTTPFVSENGVLVAYRGNEDGFRDMWMARFDQESNAFAVPECVVEPTWEFSGCPHDGPALARTPAGLHMAWMDAHTGSQQVYLTTMPEGVPDSHSRVNVVAFPAEGDVTQGHPQIAPDGNRLYIVWDQSLPSTGAGADSSGASSHQHGVPEEGAGRAIYLACSDDGGRSFSTPVPIASQPGIFQTRPQVAVGPAHSVFVTWMELSDSGKDVVIARLLDDETHALQLAAERRN